VKTWLLSLIILIGTGFSAPSVASVVSFKVWKAQKVQQAQSALVRIQKELKSFSVAPPTLKVRLKQSKTNVAIAQELTPNDYFVLYLGPKHKGNAKALEKAARFMSREELAEILVGYSNHLRQGDEGPRPSFPPVLSRSAPPFSN
jgi:hypothetical protein